MTTIEKLFIQIFERKKRIIEKARHQTELFDQYLASKCLLEGIPPPPWLFNSAFPSQTADPRDFKKEDLISGLLLPHPQPALSYSSVHCSLYNNPAVAVPTEEFSDALLTENCAANDAFEARDVPTVVPQSHVNDIQSPFNGVHKLETNATSPEYQIDASISDIFPDQDQSVARIQRSKSRQRALELRNSVKAGVKSLSKKNSVGVDYSEITESRIEFLQPKLADKELELSKHSDIMNESCGERQGNIGDCLSKEKGKSECGGIITRSKSSCHQLNCMKETAKVDRFSDVAWENDGILEQSGGKSLLQPNIDGLLESVNHSDISNKSCATMKGKIGNWQSKEKGISVHFGRITRSRSSYLMPNCLNESLRPESSDMAEEGNDTFAVSLGKSMQQLNQVAESPEFVNLANGSIKCCRPSGVQSGDVKSKEKGHRGFSGRITRSQSSCQQSKGVNESLKMDCPFDVIGEIGARGTLEQSIVESEQLPNFDVLSELVNLPEFDDKICTPREAKLKDWQSKEKDNSTNFDRIIRSRSSCLTPNCLNELLKTDSSSDIIKEVGDTITQSKSGYCGRIARSKSSCQHPNSMTEAVNVVCSCDDAMENDGTIQQSVGKLLLQPNLDEVMELVDPSGINDEICSARKGKIGDWKIKERDNSFYNGRITRSRCSYQTPNHLNESLKVESSMVKEGDGTLQQLYQVAESPEFLNLADVYSKSCVPSRPREAQIADVKSKEKGDDCRGVITEENGDKSTLGQSIGKQQPNFDVLPEFVSPNIDDECCGAREAKIEDVKEKDSGAYCGRIRRPRSSYLVPNCLNELSKVDNSFALGKSIQQLCHVSEVTAETVGPKAEIGGSKSKETNNVYCDQMTRSRSSYLGQLEKTSEVPVVHRPAKETSEECQYVAHTSLESDKISEQALPSIHHSPTCVVSEDKSKSNYGDHRMNTVSDPYKNANDVKPQLLWSSISADEDVGCSKSTEFQTAKKFVRPGRGIMADTDACPQYKRRKIEGQPTSDFTASSSPRIKPHLDIHKGTTSRYSNGEVNNTEAIAKLQHFVSHEDILLLNVNRRPDLGVHGNMTCHLTEGLENSLEVCEEGPFDLKGRHTSANIPITYESDVLGMSSGSRLPEQATRDAQGSSVGGMEVADGASIIPGERSQSTAEYDQNFLHPEGQLDIGNKEEFTIAERTIQEPKCHMGEDGVLSCCSVGPPHSSHLDFISSDQTIPMLEGFLMQAENGQPSFASDGLGFDDTELPKFALERASVLEHLCKSASLHTPLCQFSDRTPGLHRSIPNGLLEHMDLSCTFHLNDDSDKLIKAISSCKNDKATPSFQEKSNSERLPFSSVRFAWDIKKPHASPVGKLWDGIALNSRSSGTRESLNPEFTCFTIAEEETGNTDEVVDTSHEGNGLLPLKKSARRVALAKIKEECPKPPTLVFAAEAYSDRSSLDSISTDISFTGTHNRVEKKLGNHLHSKKKSTNKAKEKQSSLVASYGVKRTESLNRRASKKKLSERNSLQKKGSSLSDRDSKCNNIVSNITSFIPLVQQKQVAAAVTGKRDIKVKALETAEAVRRIAEKRENERKMKKEAMKLQRAKLEQKRQLEQKKKRKEEEQKKKDVDMAVKKRLREEEERKDKEKKRKHIEAGRRQQREDEKIHAEKDKDFRKQAQDERLHEIRKTEDETGKYKNIEKERVDDTIGRMPNTEPSTTRLSTSDARKGSFVIETCEALSGCGDVDKVISNVDIASENDNSVIKTSLEQSYEISPYRGSDDEEEDDDEDDISNRKFIPQWASRNCVALIVSSQQKIDPDVIFPPERSCNIAEVLLPRKQFVK